MYKPVHLWEVVTSWWSLINNKWKRGWVGRGAGGSCHISGPTSTHTEAEYADRKMLKSDVNIKWVDVCPLELLMTDCLQKRPANCVWRWSARRLLFSCLMLCLNVYTKLEGGVRGGGRMWLFLARLMTSERMLPAVSCLQAAGRRRRARHAVP